MKLLLTNDDGIQAEGIAVLERWAKSRGHQVVVVAPKSNYSGQSGAITIDKSLTVTQRTPGHWAVGGTPADCVRIALAFLGYHPELVVSGINHGYNLGFDTYASGTVGAARMAVSRRIPALALSAEPDNWGHVAALLDLHGDSLIEAAQVEASQAVVSVNFPAESGQRVAWGNLSDSRFEDQLEWAEFDGTHHIVGLSCRTLPPADADGGTDARLVADGFTTLTRLPLQPQTETVRLARSS